MLYLLDANVLIDANRDYYPLGRVPEFWEWLVDRASRHQVKIPLDMYEEILAGGEDDLTEPSQTIATCQGSVSDKILVSYSYRATYCHHADPVSLVVPPIVGGTPRDHPGRPQTPDPRPQTPRPPRP